MKVFDELTALRPDVDPMPLAERRMIREQLFGIGHGDSTVSIRSRSESGAVVSTAPRGSGRPVRVRPKRGGSILRIAAGVVALGAIAAVGLSLLDNDEDAAAPAPTDAPTTVPPSTAVPSTAAPFVRTGVTNAMPVLLPATLITADQVEVNPASPANSALLLQAPDGSTVWFLEVDGAESGEFGLEIQPYGATAIGRDPSRTDDELASYRPVVPCGFVVINDGIAQQADRPLMLELFEAMSVDNQARLDINLPNGWSVLDIGATQTEYSVLFRITDSATPATSEGDDAGTDDNEPAEVDGDLVLLRQIPGGSIAQFGGNGQRLASTTLLGGPAYIDTAPLNPDTVSLFWTDQNTAFNISSSTLSAAELADFIGVLEPSTIDEWLNRFGQSTPAPPDEVDLGCDPQPSFGSTLNP